MGAKRAAPDRTVVNVMGDAAFGMVGMDVETAVREHIPILTVVLNNSAMGNYERYIPKASERYRTKYLTGQYVEVARGLGVQAERVDQPREIGPALERALTVTREGKPALVEFITREEPDMAIAGPG
jgi:thiamine pyrophosphate-dependent acetolactate synthase large subunit-like protein